MGAVEPSDIIPGEMEIDLDVDVSRIPSTPASIHHVIPGHHLRPGGPPGLVPDVRNIVLDRPVPHIHKVGSGTQIQTFRNALDNLDFTGCKSMSGRNHSIAIYIVLYER